MSWLLQFCAARAAFATMFTAWSAVLPLLRTDWQMTAWQAGMVQSAYHVGFLVSLFSVGFLSDRFGARRIYLLTGAAAVASGLLFAFLAEGFASALLLYGLTGLCSGGSYTPGLAIVAQRMPERRGLALGFYLAAASLGYAIGLLIASAMIPLAGWRGGFVVTALFPAVRPRPRLVGSARRAQRGARPARRPRHAQPHRRSAAQQAGDAVDLGLYLPCLGTARPVGLAAGLPRRRGAGRR
jgi:MFS family permease